MLKACEIEINGRVIYPGHGLAIVTECVTQDIGGGQVRFFKLVFPYNKNMEILVPEGRIKECGIRQVSIPAEIDAVFAVLKAEPEDLSTSFGGLTPNIWKKRQKNYRSMIDNGQLIEVAKIYRDLTFAAERKELSFCEKDMLNKAEGLISQEIHAARRFEGGIDNVVTNLRAAVRAENTQKVKKVQSDQDWLDTL